MNKAYEAATLQGLMEYSEENQGYVRGWWNMLTEAQQLARMQVLVVDVHAGINFEEDETMWLSDDIDYAEYEEFMLESVGEFLLDNATRLKKLHSFEELKPLVRK